METSTDKRLGADKVELRLRLLLEISRSLSEEVELRALLALVAARTSEAIGVERTSVWLHDAERRELWTVVAEGELKEIRMADTAGVAGWVLGEGRPTIVQDVAADPRWNPKVDVKTGYVTRNMLCAPMENARGQCLGVFQCLNSLRGDFTEEDLTFLEAIASQAGVYVENAKLFDARKKMFDSLVDTLGESIESRDPLTAGHSRNVMRYAVAVAREMGLPPGDVEVIRYAALLHDYGKIGVPDEVLRKPARLTAEEYAVIQRHVVFTEQILSRIHFEDRLREVPLIAARHHERMDGSGYPRGLRGEEIPLCGRIIAVADVFDAVTSKRHYRGPMTAAEAMELLEEGAGSQFDAAVVAAFRRMLEAEGELPPAQGAK